LPALRTGHFYPQEYPGTHFERLSRPRAHGLVGCLGKSPQWHDRGSIRGPSTSSAATLQVTTTMYDTFVVERIFRCLQHFSTPHILSNHFTYLNSLTLWTFSIVCVKISHITYCLSGTGSVPVFRLTSFKTNVGT
jgi:hypothetical protein